MLGDILDPERLPAEVRDRWDSFSSDSEVIDLVGADQGGDGLLGHTLSWTRIFGASGVYDWFLTNPLTMWLSWGDARMGKKYRDFAAEFIAGLTTDWFLDLPCGSGIFSLGAVAEHDALKVLAADYAPAMLRRYRRVARARNLAASRFRTVRVDAGQLPFRGSSVPASLCQNGLHAYPDPEAAVTELSRVLRTGAPFALSAHVSDQGRTFFERFVLGPVTGLPYHHRESDEWLELLEEQGLAPGEYRVESKYLWVTGTAQ